MELRAGSSVRDVLRRYPATREVFERYGLMGCGGSAGPDERIDRFARAHQAPMSDLILALKEAAQGSEPPQQRAAAETQPEDYRYFLRAAALIGAFAGAALGAINLTWIATWGYTGMMPTWDWWPALVQAHGNAQLYGWCGLFIIGIASHSLPRMLRKPGPSPVRLRVIFGLIFSGLILGLVTQPLAYQMIPARLFVLSSALQWAGVLLFAGWLLRTIGLPTEPHLALISAGAAWFAVGATLRLVLSIQAVATQALTPDAAYNAAYLHAMSWGFLLSFVLGYSMRLLPAFLGLPPIKTRPAWGAAVCLTAGGIAEVIARGMALPGLSVLAVCASGAGVALGVLAVQIWAPLLSTEDAATRWLAWFARTAYAWLVIAAVILIGLRGFEATGPVFMLHQHAFGGASRHALTVGFVSLMIVGVSWRILPIFSGAERAHPALLPAVYGLLLTGCAFRVTGQMAAGLWGGAWYGLMGLSGWLETLGITLFALDVVRLLQGTPDAAALPEIGPDVEVSLEAPVGPLVAHRPWLAPVFARYGMGQVTNPLFQRTVGQRVTVAQACRRFQAAPGQFLEELQAADSGHRAG
ncbi:MAG: hypothetical protein ACO1SX_19000 [Actinomycetota bacterium]